MIRYRRIAERTYEVRRGYGMIGWVSEPEYGRSGWFAVLPNDINGLCPSIEDIVNHFAGRYRSRGRSPFVHRYEAANWLLEQHGYDPIEPPTRSRSRSTARSRERAWGVEIEITGPSAGEIENALIARGVRVTTHNLYRRTNTASSWELKRDGSVNGHGLELASPKLCGERGFNELKLVCEALNSVGATVDQSCGLHVHYDFRGLGVESIKRQVLAFVDRQRLIRKMVAPSRRGNDYCPEWSREQRETLANHTRLRDIAYIGPRGAINLQAYARHGSVEIRYHGGTTDYEKISAWVRFGQALFAAAEAGATIPTDTVEHMLVALCEYGLTIQDTAILLRFEHRDETREQVELAMMRLREEVLT